MVGWDSELPVEKQGHHANVFSYGCSGKAKSNWTIAEKEAFPIIMALEKTDYIPPRLNDLECIVIKKISFAILLLIETQRKAQLGDSIIGA